MSAKNNLVGRVYDYLTVVREGGRDRKSNVLWECRCICGNTVLAHAYDLGKRVVSCKCKPKAITHGMGRKGVKRSRIYSVWAAMITRCTSNKCRTWSRYGGRGIEVHPAWRKFPIFYAYVGDPPFKGATLDRVDNSKGYEPGNVRWATRTEQVDNRDTTIWITIEGSKKPQAHWLRILGKSSSLVCYYVKRGYSREEIIARWLEQAKA